MYNIEAETWNLRSIAIRGVYELCNEGENLSRCTRVQGSWFTSSTGPALIESSMYHSPLVAIKSADTILKEGNFGWSAHNN
ncbi:hypothetical protein KM043_011507 [Ampulex compressa]|nr:hypothetical protein KM043_011507 [Ampulex compressa]